jgi:hypothetical protein
VKGRQNTFCDELKLKLKSGTWPPSAFTLMMTLRLPIKEPVEPCSRHDAYVIIILMIIILHWMLDNHVCLPRQVAMHTQGGASGKVC